MSENCVNYAQKLRQQAEALLSIAEQLEKEANQEEEKTIENQLPPVVQTTNASQVLSDDPLPTPKSVEVTRLKSSQILLSRSKYQTCHIRLPQEKERFPAVVVDRDYYSLVRVFADIKPVLAAKAKLEWNGDRTVITQIATGYALWVWEPDAERDYPPEEDSQDPQDNLVNAIEHLHVVAVPHLQNQAQVSLTEYLLVFNRLSEWANQYLGTAVVVHYWKSTRPELAWLEQFEVVASGQIICRNLSQLSLNLWQEKQLQLWLQRFIKRCRKVIRDFPQPFLAEYKSAHLLATLLEKNPIQDD